MFKLGVKDRAIPGSLRNGSDVMERGAVIQNTLIMSVNYFVAFSIRELSALVVTHSQAVS